MAEYLIYFNQQWVGDHPEEWFRGRGPRAMGVVNDMKAAGVYVFAGGLEEEDGPVYHADPNTDSGTAMVTDGRLSACPIAKRGRRSVPAAAPPDFRMVRRVSLLMTISPDLCDAGYSARPSAARWAAPARTSS